MCSFLNEFFTGLDVLCEEKGVQKVETAGDCYIACSGILAKDEDGFAVVTQQHSAVESASKIMALAKAIMKFSMQVGLRLSSLRGCRKW